MLIANNISSNDIRHKMRFFLDKKTPNEPIRNKQIEIIKFNNIGKLILKMLKIIYTYNKNQQNYIYIKKQINVKKNKKYE